MKVVKNIILFVIILTSVVFVVVSWLWFYSDDILTLNVIRKESKTIGVVMMGGVYGQALDGLIKGLNENGYFQNQNITYFVKDLEGDLSKTENAVEELKNEKIDLIYTISTPITEITKKLVNDIPIVFNIVGDPIGAGFAKNYSGSEGNLTGCTNLSSELSGKRLEIFKEAFPFIRRVIAFYNPSNKASLLSIISAKKAGEILNIDVSEVRIASLEDLKGSLNSLRFGIYDGIYIIPDALVVSHIDMIVEKSKQMNIPTMGHAESVADEGITLTYGANFIELGRQCATVVNSIFEGKEIKSIPLMTPERLDIVINKKVLDGMQLEIDNSVISRADKIIHD